MQIIYVGTACFTCTLYLALETALFANLPLPMVACLGLVLLFAALLVKKERGRSMALLGFFVVLGLLSGLRIGPSAAVCLQPYFGQQVVVAGRVEPLSVRQGESYTSIILQCEGLQLKKQVSELVQFSKGEQLSEGEQSPQGASFVSYTGRLRLSLPRSHNPDTVPALGSLVVSGRLEPLAGLRNPGGFDSELYNRINNIGGRLAQARLLERSTAPASVLSWHYWQSLLLCWNGELRRALQRNMGESAGALLGSMLLGGSSTLEEDTRDIFAANGLSHLLSVSGTHVVLLANLLMLFLQSLSKPLRKPCLLVSLCLYAVLCGLRPPVLRALLMSAVVLFAPGDDKNTRVERGILLCLVALVLLVVRPLWLLDLGFQLSFGAAAGLLWLGPACKRLLPQRLPYIVREGAAMTMAAQLATLPVLVANFHQISLISVLSNVMLVPVLELVALVGIVSTLLAMVPVAPVQFLGQQLAYVANFFLEQLLLQGRLLARLPYGQLVLGSPPTWCAVLYYALLLLWADLPAVQFWRNYERRLGIFLLSSVLLGTLLWQHYGPRPLTVYFLDVGQGDCVVMVTPKGRIIVYDTGGLPSLDTGKKVVAPFVRSLGRSQVDVLILSHYDFDHVGGAVGLLEQMQVGEIILPRERLDANNVALYEALAQAAGAQGAPMGLVQQGEQRRLGAGVLLRLATPAALLQGGPSFSADFASQADWADAPTGNAASTLAALTSPHGSLLLTGDLGSEEEKMLNLGHFDVFKAGHHGSQNSNSEELLQSIRPLVTVISCGYRNQYHHPHGAALARLKEAGSRVLRTDKEGSVRIIFDESGIKCYSYIHNRYELTQVISKKEW